jgi:hypothetical protein
MFERNLPSFVCFFKMFCCCCCCCVGCDCSNGCCCDGSIGIEISGKDSGLSVDKFSFNVLSRCGLDVIFPTSTSTSCVEEKT